MNLFGFTETPEFTKKILNLLSDDQLASLQIFLCENPDFGKIIKGSGGIRKVRWSAGGKGKSGGVRVLYYWVVSRDKIIFLDMYAKNEKEILSQSEMKLLGKVVEEFKI